MPVWLSKAIEEPTIWALLVWGAKELYSMWKGQRAKNSQLLDENTKAIHALQIDLSRFGENVKNTSDLAKQIPQLQRDVDVAHSHLRMIAPELYDPPIRALR